MRGVRVTFSIHREFGMERLRLGCLERMICSFVLAGITINRIFQQKRCFDNQNVQRVGALPKAYTMLKKLLFNVAVGFVDCE